MNKKMAAAAVAILLICCSVAVYGFSTVKKPNASAAASSAPSDAWSLPQNQKIYVGTDQTTGVQADTDPEADPWGNQYSMTGQTVYGLDSTTKEWDYRFTQEVTATGAPTVSFYASETGQAPLCDVGIMGDVSGSPSNTYLSSTTWTAPASTSWTSAVCGTSITMTALTVYHLVVRWDATAAQQCDSTHRTNLYYITPQIAMHTFDCSADSSANCLLSSNTGTSWTAQNHGPMFTVQIGSDVEGNGYVSENANAVYGTSAVYGEIFTAPVTQSFNSIDTFAEYVGTPNDALYAYVYDQTAAKYLDTKVQVATWSQMTTSMAWTSLGLGSTQTEVASHVYDIWFTSPSSTSSSNCFKLQSTGTVSGATTQEAVGFGGLTDEMISGSASPPTTVSAPNDLNFRFTLLPDTLDHFTVSADTNPTAAGSSFSATITAVNTLGATMTDYAGIVSFTSSDGQAVLPSPFTFTAAYNGVYDLSGFTLKTAPTQTLTVTDASSLFTGTSSGITVSAGTPSTVVLSPATASIAGGNTETYTVASTDIYGNSWGDVTQYFTFSVSAGAGGSWSGTYSNTFTSQNVGSWTVTATGTGAFAAFDPTSALTVTGFSGVIHGVSGGQTAFGVSLSGAKNVNNVG